MTAFGRRRRFTRSTGTERRTLKDTPITSTFPKFGSKKRQGRFSLPFATAQTFTIIAPPAPTL